MESDIQLLEHKANLKSARSRRVEEQKEIEKLHHAAILSTSLKRVVEEQQNKKRRESFRCDNCGKSIRFSHIVRGNTYCTSCFVNNFLHVV